MALGHVAAERPNLAAELVVALGHVAAERPNLAAPDAVEVDRECQTCSDERNYYLFHDCLLRA